MRRVGVPVKQRELRVIDRKLANVRTSTRLRFLSLILGPILPCRCPPCGRLRPLSPRREPRHSRIDCAVGGMNRELEVKRNFIVLNQFKTCANLWAHRIRSQVAKLTWPHSSPPPNLRLPFCSRRHTSCHRTCQACPTSAIIKRSCIRLTCQSCINMPAVPCPSTTP
ncbi:hypothetical protein B0H14DRAFT_1127001 [Mycena olivaceomarginata]|nr:hypothetical protein B0H14DRAFT_1127001 [Mycena olivaceomarginata]